MRIQTKLTCALLAIATAVSVAVLLNLWTSHRAREFLDSMRTSSFETLHANTIHALLHESNGMAIQFVYAKELEALGPTWAKTAAQLKDEATKRIEIHFKEMHAEFAPWRKACLDNLAAAQKSHPDRVHEEAIELKELDEIAAMIDAYEKMLLRLPQTLNLKGDETAKEFQQRQALLNQLLGITERFSDAAREETLERAANVERAFTFNKGILLVVAVAVLLLALALVLGLSKILYRPLQSLTYAAQRIHDGDIACRAEVNSNDEVGLLASTFNHMTDRLQETLHARDVANLALQQQADDLKQANEEVKQFAYIVSHDLRAPLVNLKGFTAELRMALQTLDEAQATLHFDDPKIARQFTDACQRDIPEALMFIESSANRMDEFIRALLELSRIGRRELNLEHIELAEVVHTVLKSLEHQIEQTQTSVQVGELPAVLADRVGIGQIVGNILSNAVNYLESGRPGLIEIGGSQDPLQTTFYFRDNGRGIAEDDMPKVFAPFRRAGKLNVKGEGMGMAYVQALVRRHGGHIRCESQLGVGTTFTVTLPRQTTAGGAHVDHPAKQPATQQERSYDLVGRG